MPKKYRFIAFFNGNAAWSALSPEERSKTYEAGKQVRKEMEKKHDVNVLFWAQPMGRSENSVLVLEADSFEAYNQYWTDSGHGRWTMNRCTIMCYNDYQ